MLGTRYTHGSPCWIDLGSPDTAAAAEFYATVFGWEHRSAGPAGGGYGFFQQDGATVAALGPLTEEGARSAWTVYFQTSDAATTQMVTAAEGGRVRMRATEVMDSGRTAALTDPAGAEFAVWQPGSVKGLDRTSSPGALVWVELHTPDAEAALGFYRSLFEWRWASMEAPGMTYRVVSTAEGDQDAASFGGAAELQDSGERTRWIPYFEVADVDATADAVTVSGGAVPIAPTDIPDVGRLAWFTDPAGAEFAVLDPRPMG
ncbi:VOC family protein [Streptomyces sp. NPDC088090]|uniref:VOC family protein n=1 Tax=Streptomyces sp. NPDC088090 TaxID=3365822 RepID=UPI00384BEB32